MENNEKTLTWLQYQMINNYLYLFILFVLAAILTPIIWGFDYILVLPACLIIAGIIAVLGTKAYRIYAKGGTS